MPDFDKINIDSVSYNVKDTTARNAISQEILDRENSYDELDNKIDEEVETLNEAITSAVSKISKVSGLTSRRIFRGFRKSNYAKSPDVGYQMQGFTEDSGYYYVGFSGSTADSVICKINKTTGEIVNTVTVNNSHVNGLDIYNNILYCASAGNTSEIIQYNASDLSMISKKSITGLSAIASVTIDNGTIYAGGVEIIYEIKENSTDYSIVSQFNTGVNWERTTQSILVRNGRYFGLMFQPNVIISGDVGSNYDTLYNLPPWIEDLFQLGEPEDFTMNTSGNLLVGSWTLLCPRSEVAMWQVSEIGSKLSVPMRTLPDSQIPAVLSVSVDSVSRNEADGFTTPFRYISEALLSCKSPTYKQANGYTINVSSGTYDSIVIYGLSNIEILCTAPCNVGQFIANECNNITISGARFDKFTTWSNYTQLYRLYRCGYMTLSQARFVNQNANINYLTITNSIFHWTSFLNDGDNDITNGVSVGTILNVAGAAVYLDFSVPYPANIGSDSYINKPVPITSETQAISGGSLTVINNKTTAENLAMRCKYLIVKVRLFGSEQTILAPVSENGNACFIMTNIANSDPYGVDTYEVLLSFVDNAVTVSRLNKNSSGPVESASSNIVIISVGAVF